MRLCARANPAVDITTDYADNVILISTTDTSLTISNAAADAKETGERILAIETLTEEVADYIGMPSEQYVELNYFNANDLSVDTTNTARGRTKIFTLNAKKYNLSIIPTIYNYMLFKQTFVNGVQTTTQITPSWTHDPTEIDGENGANYRIMVRRVDTASMANDDLSNVKCVFTPVKSVLDNGINEVKLSALNRSVPIYYVQENLLKQAIEADVDDNSIVFTVSTDNHYNDYDWKDSTQTGYAARIAEISKEIGADFIANLGDIFEGYNDYVNVSDYHQQYINNRRMRDMIYAFTKTGVPFCYTAGHHECYPIDENAAVNATLNDGAVFVQNRAFYTSELKSAMYGKSTLARLNPESSTGMGHRGHQGKITDITDPNTNLATLNKTGASMTYYMDVTAGQYTVRFVFVDSTFFSGQGYSQDTVQFVETALTDAATNGYKVIIFTHIPLRRGQYSMNDATNAANEAAFINVLKATDADILAYIHGHVHGDNIVLKTTERSDTETYPYSDLDFPMVSISCQKIYGTAGPYIGDYVSYGTRNINSYTGYCFDTVVVHPDTRKINFFRFGAGDTGVYPTRYVN